MSVINRMLQDLERRQAGPGDRWALPDEVRALPAASRRGGMRRIGGWTLAVAAAGALAWMLATGRIESPASGIPAMPGPGSMPQGAPLPDGSTWPGYPSVGPAGAPASPGGATALLPAPVAARPSRELAGVPAAALAEAAPMADDRPARPDRGGRIERDGTPSPVVSERQATREAANAETARLAREAADAPAPAVAPRAVAPVPAPAGSATGSAGLPVSPAVAASFAAGFPPTAGTAMPLSAAAAPTFPSAAPAVAGGAAPAASRPVDTSPARIDRQEREPGLRERAEATYRRGVEAMHEGRMPAAEQALREALALFPAHEASRQTLLGMLVQQRRNADAEALLVEGQRQNPAQPGFAMALARLQAERGDTAAALESLQRSAAAGRDRPEFLGFQAGLLARAGRHADAAVQYRSALRMAPQNAVWWMGLGISLEADRRPADAAEAFQRAREATGLNAELTAYVEQRLRSLQR